MKSLEIVDKLLEKIRQYDDWFLTEVEAEQIKQDLEVLEALCNETKLTVGDLVKIKQWLEENKNETPAN